MSALLNARRSDASVSEGAYSLADLRTMILSDRTAAVAVRTVVSILIAVAAAIVIAGVATNFLIGTVGGGLSLLVFSATLLALNPDAAPSARG